MFMTHNNIVLGITGASGVVYSIRLLEVLTSAGHDVHLTISPSGRDVIEHELDLKVDLDNFQTDSLMLGDLSPAGDSKLDILRKFAGISSEDSNVLSVREGKPGEVFYHHYQDFKSPVASGSFLTDGMVVCPCSGATLSAIACGASNNLIQRAAEVHLKERRALILVPRETPLSLIQLDNMRRATEAGAVVLPAMPGWYHEVRVVRDLVDFVVAKICDQIGIEHTLMRRWGS